MYDMLRMKNERSRQQAVDFAATLIRAASPSLAEGAVAALVAQEMRRIGYDKVMRDSAGNVVGVMLGMESGPTLLLNSHMDTVTWRKDAWRRNPLGGEVLDGRLFGVGAADCKGGLAAQIYTGDLLRRSLLPLRGNLVVGATVAEDNGCSLGVRTLLEQTLPELGLKPDYAVLGEPTGLGLYYGHDGWMEVEIRIQGANPFHVDDATRSISRELQEGGSSGSSPWEAQEPRFEDSSGLRTATIRADRRLTSSESAEDVVRRLKREAELAANGGGSVAVEVAICEESQKLYTGKTSVVRQQAHAWMTDPFSVLVERSRQALAAGGCEVHPGKWELGRSGMGTAGGVLVKEFSVPTIGYGPGTEEQAHAVDEHVEVARIGQAVYGTALIAHSLIGVPVFGWTSDEA